MRQTGTQALGPEFTPKLILNLIGITAGLSLFASLTNPLFENLFQGSLCDLFCLTWSGFSHGYLWQFATFLFLQDAGPGGISFFYLIGLTFNLYVLWIVGTYLLELMGQTAFLSFYLGSGIFSGALTLFCMPLFGQYAVLSGPTASILAILTLWMMHLPELEIWLFMMFPIKAKWLIGGLIAFLLLTGISQADWIGTLHPLLGIASGYFFGLVFNGLKSPFRATHRFDNAVARWGGKLRQKFYKLFKKTNERFKIFDIETGKPLLDDESFIDAMLAKISRHGEHSLTWSEKQRMNQIAEKKKRDASSKKR